MNLFSAFTFGRLIKTFLPGFMVFVGLVVVTDAVVEVLGSKHLFFSWVTSNAVLVSFAAVPLSLVLGVLSNALFFTLFTGVLIRKPFEKKNKEFLEIESAVSSEIVQFFRKRTVVTFDTYEKFSKDIDLLYLLLPKLDLTKFIFLEESYWYYLEFHQNFVIAMGTIIAATAFWGYSYSNVLPSMTPNFVQILLIGGAIEILMLTLSLMSAKLNYDRYRKKKLSLLIGCIEKDSDAPKPSNLSLNRTARKRAAG